VAAAATAMPASILLPLPPLRCPHFPPRCYRQTRCATATLPPHCCQIATKLLSWPPPPCCRRCRHRHCCAAAAAATATTALPPPLPRCDCCCCDATAPAALPNFSARRSCAAAATATTTAALPLPHCRRRAATATLALPMPPRCCLPSPRCCCGRPIAVALPLHHPLLLPSCCRCAINHHRH
jgi:hypothetical protein